MRFITLKDNNIVGIREAKEIVQGEIQSDIGELGQILVNGEFKDEKIQPAEPIPTIETQLSELQEQNLVLMDALATIFEVIIGGQ